MNIFKITSIFFLLIFFNGCVQTTTLVGPGMTLVTTGNFLQAGFQYGGNLAIKNETGKDALTHLKDVEDEEQGNQKIEQKIKTFVKNTIDTISKKLTTN